MGLLQMRFRCKNIICEKKSYLTYLSYKSISFHCQVFPLRSRCQECLRCTASLSLIYCGLHESKTDLWQELVRDKDFVRRAFQMMPYYIEDILKDSNALGMYDIEDILNEIRASLTYNM